MFLVFKRCRFLLKMITEDEYLMGRAEQYPIDGQLSANCADIVAKANRLMIASRYCRGVRSGYRPAAINAQVPHASATSKHMTCQAVDLEDNDGKLKSWCMQNLGVLVTIGLWMESPEFTSTWCHLQTVPPKSGNRIFMA